MPFGGHRPIAEPEARRKTHWRPAAAAPEGNVPISSWKIGLGQQFRLRLAQARAGFDQMHFTLEPRPPQDAQRIIGQRAPAGPKLGINRVGGLSRPGPDVCQRRADQLAEHLVDFRRGREIAGRAERIARRVIIGVAGLHIGLDAERPLAPDALGERPGRAASRHAGRARRSARPAPAASSRWPSGRGRRGSSARSATGPCAGRSPGRNSTNCESGSRMNSTPKRKMP